MVIEGIFYVEMCGQTHLIIEVFHLAAAESNSRGGIGINFASIWIPSSFDCGFVYEVFDQLLEKAFFLFHMKSPLILKYNRCAGCYNYTIIL